jgi:dTDP-4-amino-4,6-dideoxygalactose transaminase
MAASVLSLPIHPYLDEAAIDRVCAIVRAHAGR